MTSLRTLPRQARANSSWAYLERARLRTLALRAGEAWCQTALDRGHVGEAKLAAERVKDIDPPTHNLAGACPSRFRSHEPIQPHWPSTSRLSRTGLHSAVTTSSPRRLPRCSVLDAQVQSSAYHRKSLPRWLPNLSAVSASSHPSSIRWREARQGQMRFCVVSAPAGLGKSRLLDGIANRVRALGQRGLDRSVSRGEGGRWVLHSDTRLRSPGFPAASTAVGEGVIPHLVELDARRAARPAQSTSRRVAGISGPIDDGVARASLVPVRRTHHCCFFSTTFSGSTRPAGRSSPRRSLDLVI